MSENIKYTVEQQQAMCFSLSYIVGIIVMIVICFIRLTPASGNEAERV